MASTETALDKEYSQEVRREQRAPGAQRREESDYLSNFAEGRQSLPSPSGMEPATNYSMGGYTGCRKV